MSRSPSADGPANSVWRYGVYLFPLAPLSVLVGYASILLLGLGTETESVGVLAVGIVGMLSAGLGSVLFAGVTAAALVLDAHALRDRSEWTPNPWLVGGLSVLHLAGELLAVLYLLSVPAIGYYVYRRRQHVGGDGADSDEGYDGGGTSVAVGPSSSDYSRLEE